MKQIKSDLFLFVGISALVFFFALACGSPFLVRVSSPAGIPAQSQQAQPSVFQGTIVRNGERFFLRASSGASAGQIYELDDSRQVQPYEGKDVRIAGMLDSGAKLIHVARIDAA